MAWTYLLTDGTNTLDLNDGTSFKILQDGFSAPVPRLRATFAGRGNPARAGSRLMRGILHENRNVRLNLQIGGTSTDVLATNIQNLEAQLRRAQDFSAYGIGTQMQPKLQWNAATNAVFFRACPYVCCFHLTNAPFLQPVSSRLTDKTHNGRPSVARTRKPTLLRSAVRLDFNSFCPSIPSVFVVSSRADTAAAAEQFQRRGW